MKGLLIILVLLPAWVVSVMAQTPVSHGTNKFPKELQPKHAEKPAPRIRHMEQGSISGRTKAIQKLPLGYRYEKWDEAAGDYKLAFKESLLFSARDVFKIYATQPDDT